MSQSDLPELPDYDQIRNLLEIERQAIIRINDLSEDDGYVRSIKDASLVLTFAEKVQTNLWNLFTIYPSLRNLFNEEYGSFFEFLQRDTLLDLIFLDDCLLPEKEMFFFGQDGGLNLDIINIHEKVFGDWIEDKKRFHLSTLKGLNEEFDVNLKIKLLDCQCQSCIAEFRTILRNTVYKESIKFVDSVKEEISENIENRTHDISSIFNALKQNLDKKFYKLRYRLRRSSLNKLEKQVKNYVKEIFTYPSELALKRESFLRRFFTDILLRDGLSEDLIDDNDYKKFFNQLATNLWKNEYYLEKEFGKLVKSILLLKRKDISGKILKDYLGEFWIHSHARTIQRKIIYHMGPTNSGKTYHAVEALCKAKTGCYLAPLRLLAAELFDTMNGKGVVTTLLTGEEVIEFEEATHYSSTVEMARLQESFECCVIDEIQMITDPQRGWAWTRALVNIFAEEIHICGDASVYELIQQIVTLCGDKLETRSYERMTDLKVEKNPITLGSLNKSDALIVFSRRNALKYKMDLEGLGFKVSIVYGRLSPEVRREQARKFDKEITDIMVSTDAISMGMNLPIKRIVFSTLSKFIDSQEHEISESEIKQIAGRSGRFQRFPTGYVTCLTKVDNGLNTIRSAINAELAQKTKCMVGPDLDIFNQVNNALTSNKLPGLKLAEFLRLFNTMRFKKPFFCVELKEMIELAEMVEDADPQGNLASEEIFGFSCAPVNMGLIEHVQYFVWILNHFVNGNLIKNENIDHESGNIDYLETSIKCVELYQWLSRHFNGKNFDYYEEDLLENKGLAVSKLNSLLSERIIPTCSSCGKSLEEKSNFAICEECFKQRRFKRGKGRGKHGPRVFRKKDKSGNRSKVKRSTKKKSFKR